jgi:hypothetical protein
MNSQAPPPNNPLKRPMFAAFGLIGLVTAIVGVANGVYWVTALGALVFVAAGLCLRATAKGRNPRWLRAPLDRYFSR